MKVPYMDLSGKITFPDEKQVTTTEFEGYFPPKQEDDDVGDNAGTTDTHDTDSTLEAEQTADMHELRQREQVRELFCDLVSSVKRRGIPTDIWADEIENRLSVYEFWREV
jgi:cobalamin-dependent methionine synthase I